MGFDFLNQLLHAHTDVYSVKTLTKVTSAALNGQKPQTQVTSVICDV